MRVFLRFTYVAAFMLVVGLPLEAQQAVHHTAARQAAPAATGITNTQVIKMVKAGLGQDVILAAIGNAKRRSFDLTPDGLISLKVGGVSDEIIRAMQGGTETAPAAPAAAAAVRPAAAAAKPAPAAATSLPAGIYVLLDGKMVELEPSVFSQAKTGGMFLSAMTYGLKKTKLKAVLRNPRAQQRVPAVPEFYFRFEKTNSGLSDTGGFMGYMQQASSPNEFVLVRLKPSDTDRSIILGEYGSLGEDSGTRSKDTVSFQMAKLAPGYYKVTPAALESGEYAFYYAASSQAMGTNTAGRLFDFGVD